VAAGTACGLPASPLTAIPALTIVDLVLPSRHTFGARPAAGDRQLGDGHREAPERELLITSDDASPSQ
jgi:hypothetical protein